MNLGRTRWPLLLRENLHLKAGVIAGGLPFHATHLENRCAWSQFTILNQPDNLRLIHWAVLCATLSVMPLPAHGVPATLRLPPRLDQGLMPSSETCIKIAKALKRSLMGRSEGGYFFFPAFFSLAAFCLA